MSWADQVTLPDLAEELPGVATELMFRAAVDEGAQERALRPASASPRELI